MYTILCFGDYNTFGYITGSNGERYEREIRWTGRLQKLLGSDFYIIEEGLGGRTTVWDDPIEEDKNGAKYLMPCLQSHKPLDMVVLMLGTNDAKARFSLPVCDIAAGLENLVRRILGSKVGRGGGAPDVLLVCPVRIGRLTDWQDMLAGAKEKMERLPAECEKIASAYGIDFLDAGTIAKASDLDGVHLDEEGHAQLAAKLCEIIKRKYC
ncbi:MAG: SGNH/GDSL hydrolase family protein [Christensenellaceae bacterium]|nr:SGNH/GDSL hydrolase family protein [Christensenellaceae bacterium]